MKQPGSDRAYVPTETLATAADSGWHAIEPNKEDAAMRKSPLVSWSARSFQVASRVQLLTT